MIETDIRFREYNLYRRLVRRGAVGPLVHSCGSEYVSGYGEKDEFVLTCYSCNVSIDPGLKILDLIHKTVTEKLDE